MRGQYATCCSNFVRLSLIAVLMVLAPAGVSAAPGVGDSPQILVTETGTVPFAYRNLDPKSQAIKDKFLADTVKIRRALAGKQAALQALYHARTGNTAVATRLGEEIFDLREQLRVKIQATGLSLTVLLDVDDSGRARNNER